MRWINVTVLTAAAFVTVSTNVHVRNYYKRSTKPLIPANSFALAQALLLGTVLTFRYSPLHLIWLFPLTYLTGFVALRSRLVAFVAWMYGYLLAYTIPENW